MTELRNDSKRLKAMAARGSMFALDLLERLERQENAQVSMLSNTALSRLVEQQVRRAGGPLPVADLLRDVEQATATDHERIRHAISVAVVAGRLERTTLDDEPAIDLPAAGLRTEAAA